MERHSGQKQPTARTTASASGAQSSHAHAAEAPTLASKVLVVSLILASIAVTGTILASALKSITNDGVVKKDQYQAVFLENGQVYFGRLSGAPGEYVRLNDIYYLQVQQQIQPDQQQNQQQGQQQISLAKLGNELHGPEDEMFINKDRIVFWENLKEEGDVTQAIARYQNGEQPDPEAQQQTPGANTAPANTPAADENDTPNEQPETP